MKRKILYLVVGAGIIVLLGGARLYQNRLADRKGYLGNEVVFYQEGGNSSGGENAPESSKGAEKEEKPETTPANEEPQASSDTAQTASPVPEKEPYEKILSKGKVQIYDSGTVVLDDAGYELYNYVNSVASRYAKAINKLTKSLDSSVKVYDLIAPTSVDITFPDNKKKKLNCSSQEGALKEIEKKLSGREIFVPLYDKMMQHRTEYIYFRTDHHWTSLGAYYAYEAFCEAKGITPNELPVYQKESVEGFLGSFYRETNNNKNLKEDTLEVLYPLSDKLSMKYTTTEGQTLHAPVIADASKYSSSLKYCAYIAGDNPYTVIQNKEIKDGSSCVVVKESYGNAFVPFLADHYQTVYVIDYRYWEGKLCDFIREKKTREVILVNNISMTRNSYLIGKLMTCLGS